MYVNTKLSSLSNEQIESKMLAEITAIFVRYGYDKTESMKRKSKKVNRKYR